MAILTLPGKKLILSRMVKRHSERIERRLWRFITFCTILSLFYEKGAYLDTHDLLFRFIMLTVSGTEKNAPPIYIPRIHRTPAFLDY